MQVLPEAEAAPAIGVQGFRSAVGNKGSAPVVVIMVDGPETADITLTPENANILGEFLRSEAEFANSSREAIK